ncbi:phosphotransferase [Salidesulfovibrio onnuriiensis]|uniref:phosphotransferase n=1 Tax=Salidesulfovibrio onnuriiensis TaxID=2583823 RepID=UPI0011CCA372|nr:phosphotransferase [Salidesulfovibrio onnuriiensis]
MIGEKDIMALARKYYPGLGEVYAVTSMGGGACRVLFNDREAVLKFHAHWVRERILLLEDVMRAAYSAGLGAFVFPSKAGTLLVKEGEDVFSLQMALVGEAPAKRDIHVAATFLGRLHRILAKVQHREVKHHLFIGGAGLPELARNQGLMAEAEMAEPAELWLKKGLAQLVHGDPHPANMVLSGEAIRFIDFDSTHVGSPAQEAAFAAFRLVGADTDGITDFAETYGREYPDSGLTPALAGTLALHGVLRRLVFILSERDRGESRWMSDLKNQRRFVEEALQLAVDLQANKGADL